MTPSVAMAGAPKRGRDTVRRALGYFRPYRLRLVAALACVGVQTALSVAPFLIVKWLIDDLRHPDRSFSTILRWSLAGIRLALAASLVALLRDWSVLRMTTSIVADMRRQRVSHVLHRSGACSPGT